MRGWPRWPGIEESARSGAAAHAGRAPGLQAHRHLRRRVRLGHALHVLLLRAGEPEAPGACEADPSDRRKVIILGGGPNRIGQGIEFDYCCVHAAYALREAGIETIMVNCNPGDRLDRLRHLRPALFRAADRRGRDRDRPHRAAPRQAARRASSSSAARRRSSSPPPSSRPRSRSSAPRPTPSTWPRIASASRSCWPGSASKQPANGIARNAEEAREVAAAASAIPW